MAGEYRPEICGWICEVLWKSCAGENRGFGLALPDAESSRHQMLVLPRMRCPSLKHPERAGDQLRARHLEVADPLSWSL